MVTFMDFDIQAECSKEDVFHLCQRSMPNMNWRMGESDMAGGYVSGSQSGVQVKCWTGENLMAFSLSFLEEVPEEIREHWIVAARVFLLLRLES